MTRKTQRTLNHGITVAVLIETLRDFERDAVVLFTCDYGDYCHTRQALPVISVDPLDEQECIKESGYSQSGLAIGNYDETEGDEDDAERARPNVVLLS